ncbi:alpha/beta hydrolase [Salpingoeca rosetta]|uniref:Alpha/beta hydrolase n=1 Tax=Salpingoeca rosetta (strain ATCC 50818 / BSB-021) TaxID=946362 RepID=F2UHR6_SALR5|nr:alpha/beta hydrolase [Salpingoeca rosetta]EGD76665.1 alpha/beta hydrolase [Salpingoeca rosetta]|eukprot:XP_004991037.1 alpha/beta hydrolase [Salpingoeca rosetta]
MNASSLWCRLLPSLSSVVQQAQQCVGRSGAAGSRLAPLVVSTSRLSSSSSEPKNNNGDVLTLAHSVVQPSSGSAWATKQTEPVSKDASSSAPIVFLHGLFGSQLNFRTIGRMVADHTHRPVVLLDLRNHGRSPHAPTMSYEQMAGDVAHTLREGLGVSRASLVGHSMGGKTAMMTALLHPDLVQDLVVVDIAPVTYPLMRDTMRVAQAMKQVPLASGHIRTRQDADAALKDNVTDPIVRRFVLTNFVQGKAPTPPTWRVNLDAILHEMHNLSGFPLLPGDAACADLRTLFLHGSRSNYVLDVHEEPIHAFFPRAERTALDAGHWVHAEKQAEFVRTVVGFLSHTPAPKA